MRLDFARDPVHREDRFERIHPDSGFGGEHHRVGPVEDRIRDVGDLGTRRPGIGDHRLQHLCRRDHRLAVPVRALDHPLLHQGHRLDTAVQRRDRRGAPP